MSTTWRKGPHYRERMVWQPDKGCWQIEYGLFVVCICGTCGYGHNETRDSPRSHCYQCGHIRDHLKYGYERLIASENDANVSSTNEDK
jgi:hypothetical protein